MIAIIKNSYNMTDRLTNHKPFYVTNVLAVNYDYYNPQAIVFDSTFTKILKLDMYGTTRRVYMIQGDNLDFINGQWQGLDWVINDGELIAKLENGSVDVKDYPKAQEYAYEVELPEWFEVNNEMDAKNLIDISVGFHSAYINSASIDGNNMELVLDETFSCKFTLRFIDIMDMDIVDKIGKIYKSEMSVEDGVICWTIIGWESCVEDEVNGYNCSKTNPYIKCKKILWKMEPRDD